LICVKAASVDADRTDLVFLHNGDQVTGEVKGLQRGKLAEKIIKYLSSIEKPAAQTIKMLASSFEMSQATFGRNLAKENTSFKQIRNKSLENIYLKLLITSDIKIEDIALKLGYSGHSSFERSFCARFGIRPARSVDQ
jgi:AraC-like DNA-binding protein